MPLIPISNAFLSCGLVRTDYKPVENLYHSASEYSYSPSLWEGLFRLSCLLNDNPLNEPVAASIMESLKETENGAFEGPIKEQVQRARAAFALFEYTADRSILKRIASWFRYLEIEWDTLFGKGEILFHPADLMELLIRFYVISGIKSVLRLCARLRSAAFDWTTVLHTVQQTVLSVPENPDDINKIEDKDVQSLDFDEKRILINHADALADGLRYSLYSAIFSGNGQELSAGKTAWTVLRKHHYAVCGGTTSEPFLAGTNAGSGISTAALSAWTEAFAAQMLFDDSAWAADELIRIVFNGLAYCLKKDKIPNTQYVNQYSVNRTHRDAPELYARLTRSAASVFHHAVSLSNGKVKINYLLPARYIVSYQKQPIIVSMDTDKIVFHSKNEVSLPVSVFYATTETAEIALNRNGLRNEATADHSDRIAGKYLNMGQKWRNNDSISFEQKANIRTESTHHQGRCFFIRNQLMTVEPVSEKDVYAVIDPPDIQNGKAEIKLWKTKERRKSKGISEDIPVLPKRSDEQPVITALKPYCESDIRISMFPGIIQTCLK